MDELCHGYTHVTIKLINSERCPPEVASTRHHIGIEGSHCYLFAVSSCVRDLCYQSLVWSIFCQVEDLGSCCRKCGGGLTPYYVSVVMLRWRVQWFRAALPRLGLRALKRQIAVLPWPHRVSLHLRPFDCGIETGQSNKSQNALRLHGYDVHLTFPRHLPVRDFP